MRCLNKNKRLFYYANFVSKTERTDADGYYTGEYTVTYGNPVAIKANISSAKGTADVEQFGVNESYDKTIVIDDPNCPITETSILWIDTMPVITQGTTNTKNDYKVTKVARSLNSVTYAVKKVDVS